MNNETAQTIRNDIATLRTAGVTDILVSVNANGQAIWGEPMALERATMAAAIAELATDSPEHDWNIDDMLTADEFETRPTCDGCGTRSR